MVTSLSLIPLASQDYYYSFPFSTPLTLSRANVISWQSWHHDRITKKHKINVNAQFSGDIKIRGWNGSRWAPGVSLPTSMILVLLFPVLTLLFVSAYGWIISELLLEWSLATICGHLFNNMVVWEGYERDTLGTEALNQKKKSIYLFLLLISHRIPVF